MIFIHPAIEWNHNMLNTFVAFLETYLIHWIIYFNFIAFWLLLSNDPHPHTITPFLRTPQAIQRNFTIQLQSLLFCIHSESLSLHHQHRWNPWLGQLSHSLHSPVVLLNILEFPLSSSPQRHLLGVIFRLRCCSCRTLLICNFQIYLLYLLSHA